MELYHIGEGIQGILNGCNDIIECQEKLEELTRLLEQLVEQQDGSTNTIDRKIAMVEDTIAQYKVLIWTL